MKKTVGVLIVAVLFGVVGFLSVFFGVGKSQQSAVSGEPILHNAFTGSGDVAPGLNSQFRFFQQQAIGIFIKKDPPQEQDQDQEQDEFFDPADYFEYSVMVTDTSGNNLAGRPYNEFITDWRSSALLADSTGNWEPTKILQISTPEGNRGNVTYRLPRVAPAGKYAVRMTAYQNGQPVFRHVDEPVSTEFVIMYTENITRMYLADDNGEAVHNVFTSGLGGEFTVRPFANPGAMLHELLEAQPDTQMFMDFVVGNLTPEIMFDIENLNWHIEDAWGRVIPGHRVVPIVEVDNGGFKIGLPESLPRGNYVLRVYQNITDEVYGTYVISFGGVYAPPGSGLAAAAPGFLIFGLILCLAFGFMFLAPKVEARVNKMRYEMSENKRIKQRSPEVLTAEFTGSDKRVATKQELDKLSDLEKEELFKQRTEEAKVSKGGSFLGKMAENRQKREIAREAGITMDEYREIEEKVKKSMDAKEVGLEQFRKAVEERTGIVTQQQEDAHEAAKAEPVDTRPKRASGQPEFELLDSLKDSDYEVPEEVAQIKASEEAAAAAGQPAAETRKWKQALVDLDDDTTSFDKPAEVPDAVEEQTYQPESQQVDEPSFDQPAEMADTDPAPEQTHQPEDKHDEQPEEKKPAGSILQRLRNLAGEDD